ncbi:hypothetical protein [Paracoccus mutanolyticus]|uniref:hypothetical protein n=1 Tax=Paracoccus mutanolyticus TaxID=1499308 RepID=UPI00167406C4|nr:hypothetical protein [Paracoccus mutanolyticus]
MSRLNANARLLFAHEQIVDAIRAGDTSRARVWMEKHVHVLISSRSRWQTGQGAPGSSPNVMARAGMAHAPQEHTLFQELTVEDNLRLGGPVIGGPRGIALRRGKLGCGSLCALLGVREVGACIGE